MGMRGEFRGQVIGRGPWKADWYSICSAHSPRLGDRDRSCRLCMTGHYVNRWRHGLERLAYRHAYPLWHWWANRPSSRSRRFLEEVFPNLRGR
jgi:hypothetical protein